MIVQDQQLIGKTIAAVGEGWLGSAILLVFSDGTFAKIRSRWLYDDTDICFEDYIVDDEREWLAANGARIEGVESIPR